MRRSIGVRMEHSIAQLRWGEIKRLSRRCPNNAKNGRTVDTATCSLTHFCFSVRLSGRCVRVFSDLSAGTSLDTLRFRFSPVQFSSGSVDDSPLRVNPSRLQASRFGLVEYQPPLFFHRSDIFKVNALRFGQIPECARIKKMALAKLLQAEQAAGFRHHCALVAASPFPILSGDR